MSKQLSKEEELESKLPLSSPVMHHTSSVSQPMLSDKELDIGILFSEPIFDSLNHKDGNLPLDYRLELQRLYSALNVMLWLVRAHTNPKSQFSARSPPSSISNISSATNDPKYYTLFATAPKKERSNSKTTPNSHSDHST